MSRLKALAALALVLFATTPSLADDGKRDSTSSSSTKSRPKPKPAPPAAPPPPKAPAPAIPRAPGVPHATPTVPVRTVPTAQPVTRPLHAPAPASTPHVARPTVPTPVRDPHPAEPAGPADSVQPVEGWRTSDHRYAHPDPHYVPHSPEASYPPPAWDPYRPWYTNYWVHPWWRWTHATVVVVSFDHACSPWVDVWTPPPRPGFVWMSGHWEGPYWVPGSWVMTYPPSSYATYHWVSGWWLGDRYVEGYWRVNERPGWYWVDGAYYADNSYAWGAWYPLDEPLDGYVWEAGFWDGRDWVEGFWRPEQRDGYRWVTASYGPDSVYSAGYWEPLTAQPGQLWIPGWFDGESWVEGYWVPDDTPEVSFTPPEGWTTGGERPAPLSADAPLAIPAVPDAP